MQVSSAVSVHQVFSPCSGSDFTGIAGKFEEEFTLKLRLNDEATASLKDEKLPQEEEDEEEEQEEEFSFACANPNGSPISADDAFQNGQIRPLFPLFDRDLLFDVDGISQAKNSKEPSLRPPLRKLFVERDHASSVSSSEADEPEGPYCSWKGKAVEASPEVCKKSNSTGFSKLRRFRELVLRSNSDGKDAFVFLNNQNHNSNPSTITTAVTGSASTKTSQAEKNKKVGKEEKQQQVTKKGKNTKTASSAHEKLYIRNRVIKEEHKRKSYLPYRVGFFTNVNGLSRNIHPY
ncbi:hypothetical protein JCGZ_17746 [Jatropha curcas]|uniref:Uncharacterized protein n=1 Tax=Jatropha curcas TaxID=180498 RepID=A0A067JUS0_JATCU|nr:uncharacterized protein LOC105644596 [Jatropha curcas]KDP26588.1 hypothetical protein JCGZ_17746 [Jatropha curcas]